MLSSQIPSYAAYLLLCFIGILILIDCAKDLRQFVSARNVFLVTVVVWFILEACIVPKEIRKYSPFEYLAGLLGVLLSVICFMIGYASSRGRVFDKVFHRLILIDRPQTMWNIFLFAVVIGFLPLIFVAKGNVFLILQDAFFSKARWSGPFGRARFGGMRDAFMELQMFLRAALPIGATILMQKSYPTGKRVIVFLFLLYMTSRAFNDATRSKVVEILLPIGAAMYWKMGAVAKRRAILFGIPIVVIAGLTWSAASVIGRNEGKLKWDQVSEVDYVGFEMFRELLFLMKMVPSARDYQWGHTYLVQLVNPIPRFLWPDKPSGDAGLQLAELQGAVVYGQAYLTVSPGLIGEMYWNWGWAGIAVVSATLGYLAKAWDRARPIAAQSLITFTVFASGLAIIFVSGRSINMSATYGMLALFAILITFAKPSPVRQSPYSTQRSHY